MAFIKTIRRNTGGSGQTLAWNLQTFNETNSWVAGGLTLLLTQVPLSAESILVWSQGMPLSPDDYTVLGASIVIQFGADPAVESPETGVWQFFVQYPYVT